MNGNGECVLKLAFPIVEGTGGSKNRYLVQDEHPKVVRVGVIQSNSNPLCSANPLNRWDFLPVLNASEEREKGASQIRVETRCWKCHFAILPYLSDLFLVLPCTQCTSNST